jgi:hypothetical protein
MSLKKEIKNSHELLQQKYPVIALSMVLLQFAFVSIGTFNVFAQQQQPNAGSLVNSICQLVQDNSLISGLVGLNEALFICNNLDTIGSNQALNQLCSTISGLNVINIDTFCNQQQQQQTANQTQLPNENSQSNTETPPSSSIIDRILGLLFGFLNF